MAFEEPQDSQNIDVIIERSILWGLWKQKICIDGKFSMLEKILDRLKWRK